MDILSFLGERHSAPSPTDELLYEFVAAELASSTLKQGLWAKAMSDNNWDEPKAKAQYVKMRVSQLRGELLAEFNQRQALKTDPRSQALSFGLSSEDVEYLGQPILASQHIEKYGVSQSQLSKAISQAKIRGVLCQNVLWVQDKSIT